MYKKLNLKRENLEIEIKKYFDTVFNDNVKIEIKTIGCYQELFTIIFEKGEKILFDLYSTENGKYTFNFTQHRTSDEIREKFFYPMADWLIETCSFGVVETNFVVKNISKEDFDILVYILKENKENKFEKKDIVTWIQYKIKSQYKDVLSLIHYTTSNKLVVQGQPLYLYWEVVKIILNNYSISKDEAFEMANISSSAKSKEEVEETFKSKHSILHEKLNDDLKKFLSVYIAIKDSIIVELEDYSFICFPIFKLSEGFLRQIISDELLKQEIYLEEKGFSIDLQNSKIVFKNNSLFYLKDENYFLNNDIGGIDASKREKINKLYTYFHKQRHSCSHGKEDNGSRIIESIGEACYIGDNLLKLINNFFE